MFLAQFACVYTGLLDSISVLAFLVCLFLPTLRDGSDAMCDCFLRSSWTMRWTVTMNGKRRSQESLSPIVKG